eukprot:13683653-Alexandrium_andersonii.AAC.1
MSASLVGSEMCIRDRGPPADGLRTMGEAPFQRGPSEPSRGRFPTRIILCLLYTSDAADDM